MPTREPTPEPEHEHEPEHEQASVEPSRNRLRDQARAYLDLAEELAKSKRVHWSDPPFDEDLRMAIADAQRFVKNARARQIRRVAQLLRNAGSIEDLRAELDGRTPAMAAKQALDHRCEAWRARVLDDGDAGLAAFITEHPDADRQRLRQLARQAGRTPPDARSKRAATTLYRLLRAQLERAQQQPRDP